MTRAAPKLSWIAPVAAGLSLPQAAFGHGFGERYDLPVPLGLYLTGAGAAVGLSFVVMALFLRRAGGGHAYPRLDLLKFRIGRFLMSYAVVQVLQALSVGLLLLVIYTGAAGTLNQNRNFAVIFVWVIWWVGLAYFSALVGNLWVVVNPWQATFRWAEALYRTLTRGGSLALNLSYPRRLGVWPGLVLLWAFAWIELGYYAPSHPPYVALMAINYSYITWIGMLLFGREQWLRHGEAFSLVFSLLARFAPTELRVSSPKPCRRCPEECRGYDGECVNCYECFAKAEPPDRQWNLRPFAAGLVRKEEVSLSSMCFVLLLLSTVTFDGFMATPLWHSIKALLRDTFPIGQDAVIFLLFPWARSTPLVIVDTVGLMIVPLLFLGIYLVFCGLVSAAAGFRLSAGDSARGFIYSLIPIALAYHLAHYFTFLLIQGQWMIPLLSDPLARGWNLLGTADYRPDIGIVGAKFAWYTAVTAIVIGHIAAVYVGHVIALRIFGEARLALRSQYPMLALMVFYTVASLWILAQPIVETGGKG
ncbi:MAG: hypothetical protein ACREP8_03975 [Candidatus Binatia bacterium]